MLAILVSLALLIVLTFRKINIVVVGIAAAWFGASLFQVAAGCCAVVFVLEFFI